MMIATSEKSLGMLLQLHSIKRELEVLAQAWKQLGAIALVVLREEQAVISIPEGIPFVAAQVVLKAPFRFGDDILLLVAVGLNDVGLQARLFADAQMLYGLLRREQEIAVMADELVLYQDQILALYELNHSLRFQTKLQNILQVAVQQTRKITQSDCAFILHDTDDIPKHAQSGDYRISLEDIKNWYELMLIKGKEILRFDVMSAGAYVLLVPL